MTLKAVIDTNVLIGALLRREGQNRRALRLGLERRLTPVVGQALFLEYEDVLAREQLFRHSPLTSIERRRLFEAFLSVCGWVQVYYLWRPNLRDEADNHIMELAVASNANRIVTNNISDFAGSQLRFPAVHVVTPHQLVKELE